MAKRGPTLFELMGDGNRLRAPGASPGEHHPVSVSRHEHPAADLPGPRAALRVPTGYLFVAGAAAIAGLILAYSIGFTAGQKKRDRLDAQRLAAQTTRQAENLPTRDPLLAPTNSPANAASPDRPRSGPADQPTRASETRTAPSTRPAGDPREPGLNYFIVAYDRQAEAERAAEFLRSNGVPAAAVPADTSPDRYYVVSLRGFPASEVGSSAYTEHRSLLMRLGRVWKRDHRGTDDFSSVWAQKHQPRPVDGGRASVPNP